MQAAFAVRIVAGGLYGETSAVWFAFDAAGTLFYCLLCIVSAFAFFHPNASLHDCDLRQTRTYAGLLMLLTTAIAGAYFASNLAVTWIFLEATTLCAAGIVYHRRTAQALEAAWKYVFVCSTGIAMAYLGILLLVCSAVPFLAAITNLTALVLSLLLKGLLWLVRCCAALPFASICLPQRYTLFVLAVLGMLAAAYWYAKKLRACLPAVAACAVLAVGMGLCMQRDVVQVALVGAANNPSVVCVQNGKTVVYFRGGESNLAAVKNYLAGRSRGEPTLLVDLRAKPTELDFAAEVVTMQEQPDFATRPVLDGLALDLYHNKSASLAELEVGGRHIAVGAGNIQLAEPVRVDVLCAPGSWPDAVQPDTVLYTSTAPKWLDKAENCTLRSGEEEPGLTLRPGRSILWEEAQTVAVQ